MWLVLPTNRTLETLNLLSWTHVSVSCVVCSTDRFGSFVEEQLLELYYQDYEKSLCASLDQLNTDSVICPICQK